MIFIETPMFTKRIWQFMGDEDYRQLQNTLVSRPDIGKIIRGSGGIRKVRWMGNGQDKRGGLRIIYYWYTAEEQIYMLYVYPKSESSDLSSHQLSVLKNLIEQELENG